MRQCTRCEVVASVLKVPEEPTVWKMLVHDLAELVRYGKVFMMANDINSFMWMLEIEDYPIEFVHLG